MWRVLSDFCNAFLLMVHSLWMKAILDVALDSFSMENKY